MPSAERHKLTGMRAATDRFMPGTVRSAIFGNGFFFICGAALSGFPKLWLMGKLNR